MKAHRARTRSRACLAAAIALATASPLAASQGEVLSGLSMGTTYRVELDRLPPGASRSSLHAGIEQILGRLEGRLSTWRADSEVSRFNASRSTAWFAVSGDTERLVRGALAISRATAGAFDVSVGPLLALWGFPPHRAAAGLPSCREIDRVLGHVGFDLLGSRAQPPALRKSRPQVEIDLSAIAKGHAIDAVAAWLETRGVDGYLVELGGEIRVARGDPGRAPWAVAVAVPAEAGLRPAVIALRAGAIATSGDYLSFVELEGQRFAHVLDPRTGRPVGRSLALVSVIADSAATADAYATALLVLGPEAGPSLARTRRLAAYFVLRGVDGWRELSTAAFDARRLSP